MAEPATMDFFAHQEAARRRTSLLVGYYVVAVALIILGVYLAFVGVFTGFRAKATGELDPSGVWNPELFLWVTGITLAVVLLGSVTKIAALASGGAAVARMLGGRPISPNTRDGTERRILNIVEEMALASGIAVPAVYILDDEPGINAFAAGFTPGDAVVAVTRGCAEKLSRDELQGVVAHEFSHIFNGDMRLNIRLMGVLHGILIIAITGYWILRVGSGGRSRSRGGKGNGAPIMLLGLALMVIGYVGVFFGKLIKSAVSRQREFLADASAVQFTRNPAGIAGALKKIAGFAAGSRLDSPRAEEASHFFFANGLAQSFLNLMATHPPIEERIARIDASFIPRPSRGAAAPAAGGAPVSGFAADPDGVVASVGAPEAEHLAHARRFTADMPAELQDAVREESGARAAVYCLLLSGDGPARSGQIEDLSRTEDEPTLKSVDRLRGAAAALPAGSRLTVLDLAIPALRTMTAEEYRRFSRRIDDLIEFDRRIDLFEFTLRRVLKRHLDPFFGGSRPGAVKFRRMDSLAGPLSGLLSSLAYWGTESGDQARRAFDAGAARLGLRDAIGMTDAKDAGLQAVDRALADLEFASPAIKRQVVAACTACVAADGRATAEEGELLRAIADTLDCPIPPFVAAS